MLKKICINFLFLFIVVIALEIACAAYEVLLRNIEDNINNPTIADRIEKSSTYLYECYTRKRVYDLSKKQTRTCVEMNSSKRPILISGCSFASGFLLPEKDCIHYILAHKTNRTVSNIGVPCASPVETLWFFKNKNVLKYFVNGNFDIEYNIYIYIPEQKRRLYCDMDFDTIQYKIDKKNNTAYILPDKWFYHLFLFREFKTLRYLFTSDKKQSETLGFLLKNVYNEQKKLFPNSKMVILNVDMNVDEGLKELEKEEVQVITLGDYIDFENQKYKAFDNVHPNGLLWIETAKILEEKLAL